MELKRCVEHGLVADANGLCVLCRRKAQVSTTRQVWIGLAAMVTSGVVLAAGVWGLRDHQANERALQAAMGPAIAVHPWIELSVRDQDPSAQRLEPQAGVQGTRRFLFPPADSARAPDSAPQAESPRDAGADGSRRIQEAKQGVTIKLYMADWCSVCQRAKRWLQDKGIRYEEINVDSSESVARELNRLNPRGTIPTFQIDGRVLVGFNAGAVESAIRAASEAQVKRDDGF